VCPILPVDAILAGESDVRLVDEGGRLQCVVWPFAAQIARGAAPQLAVDQRQQCVTGLKVSMAPRSQETADCAGLVGHFR
jgi:hypothetical protein